MIQIDMPIPEKCSDCIFCDDNCSCVASDYNGLGINVGCAYRTGRRDIRCPLKEVVLCKDCKHYRYYGLTEDTVSECTIDHCENPDKEWFYADGERRIDDA